MADRIGQTWHLWLSCISMKGLPRNMSIDGQWTIWPYAQRVWKRCSRTNLYALKNYTVHLIMFEMHWASSRMHSDRTEITSMLSTEFFWGEGWAAFLARCDYSCELTKGDFLSNLTTCLPAGASVCASAGPARCTLLCTKMHRPSFSLPRNAMRRTSLRIPGRPSSIRKQEAGWWKTSIDPRSCCWAKFVQGSACICQPGFFNQAEHYYFFCDHLWST